MERYYQPEIECASREQILEWQNERLVRQVRHVWDNVPYYRKKMEEKGVRPEDIKGVSDLHKLPFLSKEDLRIAYPYGLLAEPLEKCVRIQSTSGTTGKRVVAFYTQHDIDLWEDCCARAIVAAGGTNKDVCQVSYGYGLFTGGPGLNGGSHKVGCLTIPTSSGNTEAADERQSLCAFDKELCKQEAVVSLDYRAILWYNHNTNFVEENRNIWIKKEKDTFRVVRYLK